VSSSGEVGRITSIAATNVSLQAIVDADQRLDELSTARVIGEAAEAIHKLQKGGQPLGTLSPQAIAVSPTGVHVDPPSAASTAYSAPEKLRGQAGDRRSDVFSLGVVLWEALAHARLFDGATDDAAKQAVLERDVRPPSQLNANVPAELDAICKKALARDPADRYQSAKVMAAEISAVLDDASYPETHERIAAYLEQAFPAGAPVPAAPSAGATLAAKLAATPTGSDPAPAAASPAAASTKASLSQTTLGMAPLREPAPPATDTGETKNTSETKDKRTELNKTQAMGSLVSSDLLPPSSTAPGVGVASTPDDPAAPTTPAALTPSAPIVAAAEPAGKRHSAQRAAESAVSIASAETVETPALVPTTPSKVAGLPSMPPGAAEPADAKVDTKKADTKKAGSKKAGSKKTDTKADAKAEVDAKAEAATDKPPVRPSQPAVDPRDAVSLPSPKRAKSETGEMLGGWGWTDSQDAVDDGSYDEVDEEKVRRKRLILAIGGALGVIALIVIIAFAAGGSDDKKQTPDDEQDTVANGPSRTAAAPAPEHDTAPVEPNAGSAATVVAPNAGSAAVDPNAGSAAEALAAEYAAKQAEQDAAAKKAEDERVAKEAAEAAKAEEARLAKEKADQDKALAEQARIAKEAAAKDKAEQARIAKEEAAKQKAEQARVAKEKKDAAAKQKAEQARVAKEAAAKQRAERAAKRAERAKVAAADTKKTPKAKAKAKAGPKPLDPYAESTPKQDPAAAYKTGFQQYVRGDTAGALATFKSSLAANPGYPSTYRGLGLVYEKMGNKSQAKRAFSRYLQLSPKASDADQIRERMGRL
jgi:hypothetical protein